MERCPIMEGSITTIPRKLWVLTCTALLFLLVQYQLTNSTTRFIQAPPSTHTQDLEFSSNTLENIIKRAINSSVLNKNESPSTFSKKLIEDVVSEISKELNSKSLCNRNVMKSMLITIYVVTPTYARPEQIPELTRMAQTLMHVENIHWIVVEDANTKTDRVTKFLKRIKIPYTHLTALMPMFYRRKKGNKPKGVANRNRALTWIRENARNGVLYFADDDNTYDLELFNEIRLTKRVAMWPVGLCTGTGVSTPVVRNGKLFDFYDGWIAGRKFPVDMAGFAVNINFLRQRPNAVMPYRAGYEEDGFLKSLAPLEPTEIEFLADNCSKILVWHTQTKKVPQPFSTINTEKYKNTNLMQLKELI